ncbi:hypothetical protein BD309DRAFT_993043 [Dichomitus squalens]|uniref:Uncharacterized protein n=1 Tax=Dichomitus squalens TaxID=114155 RepID=A0A4Q9PRB4_9APHY|nr:hypothetical protein BD309DRAFT_993043 [Dichomitus squalens]TBU56929.1 hypothetical protein BD310DRAFT_949797 [Dichomitus squalens]
MVNSASAEAYATLRAGSRPPSRAVFRSRRVRKNACTTWLTWLEAFHRLSYFRRVESRKRFNAGLHRKSVDDLAFGTGRLNN